MRFKFARGLLSVRAIEGELCIDHIIVRSNTQAQPYPPGEHFAEATHLELDIAEDWARVTMWTKVDEGIHDEIMNRSF